MSGPGRRGLGWGDAKTAKPNGAWPPGGWRGTRQRLRRGKLRTAGTRVLVGDPPLLPPQGGGRREERPRGDGQLGGGGGGDEERAPVQRAPRPQQQPPQNRLSARAPAATPVRCQPPVSPGSCPPAATPLRCQPPVSLGSPFPPPPIRLTFGVFSCLFTLCLKPPRGGRSEDGTRCPQCPRCPQDGDGSSPRPPRDWLQPPLFPFFQPARPLQKWEKTGKNPLFCPVSRFPGETSAGCLVAE